jgi:hypothetical protein
MDAMVTFSAGDTNYNPINSLVLLVASNIAYEEFDVIKDSSNSLLGFTPDKVAVIKERDNLFYIASDPQKIFIVFRGMTDLDKEKKMLRNAKKANLYLKKQDVSIPGDIFSYYCKYVTAIYDKLELVLNRWFFKNSNQLIYLTGHDTGGAMAILVAHCLSYFYKEIGAVYAFGSPKIGDLTWGKSYPDWLAQRTYRVNHDNDFVAGLPSGAKLWTHVGQSCPPKTQNNQPVQEPHSVESYFKSLLPAHQAALGEVPDRISIRSQKILKGISKRETIRLVNYNFDNIAEDPEDQNARYQLPQSSNIVRVPQNKNRRAQQQTQESYTNYLIAPDLLQQIRNNVYILISNSKSIYNIIFLEEKGDLNQLLSSVMSPMKNLIIITGLIVSQNAVVSELVRSINSFLEVSDTYYQYAGDVSISLDMVERAYGKIMPAAKLVVANCEKVSGK